MWKGGGLGSTLSLWEEDLAIMFLFGGCGLSREEKSKTTRDRYYIFSYPRGIRFSVP